MSSPRTAADVLDRDYLEARAKLLELGATLDRIAAAGGAPEEPRTRQLGQAIELLRLKPEDAAKTNRAEQLQLLFSLPYDDSWRARFGV